MATDPTQRGFIVWWRSPNGDLDTMQLARAQHNKAAIADLIWSGEWGNGRCERVLSYASYYDSGSCADVTLSIAAALSAKSLAEHVEPIDGVQHLLDDHDQDWWDEERGCTSKQAFLRSLSAGWRTAREMA